MKNKITTIILSAVAFIMLAGAAMPADAAVTHHRKHHVRHFHNKAHRAHRAMKANR